MERLEIRARVKKQPLTTPKRQSLVGGLARRLAQPLGAIMDNKQLKSIFNKIASANGFAYKYSAWFRETDDCIVVLSLQKSNYSHLYYVNIKTYIKGAFGEIYSISKDLVRDTGDVFRREPKGFESALDLESDLSILEREKEIDKMFKSFINPYTNTMLTKDEIIKQYREGSEDFYLLPAIRQELGVA